MISINNISPPEEICSCAPAAYGGIRCLLIKEIFGTLTQCQPLPATLDAIAEVIHSRLDFHACAILLKRPGEGLLSIEGAAGLSASYVEAVNYRYPAYIEDLRFSEGPSSQAFLTLRPAIVEDIEIHTGFQRWRAAARQQGIRSLISLPLPSQDGLIGTLVCYRRHPHHYHDDEVQLLTDIATLVGTAIEIANTMEKQGKTAYQLEEAMKELREQHHLLERWIRRGFAGDLITGRYDDAQQMQDRSRYLGYDLREPFQVLVFDFDPFDHSASDTHLCEMDIAALRQRLLDAIRHVTSTCGLPALVTNHQNQLVMILSCIDDPAGKLTERAVTTVQRTACQLSSEQSISVGIGQVYAHLDQIRTSYREATHALQVIRRLGGRAKKLTYSELGVVRLLFQVENTTELINYARTRLRTVLAYDRQHNGVLMQTLEAYLATNQSVPLASQQLGLHPNTFRYRLRKVEDLLGDSLNNTAILLDLQLACLVLRMIDTEPRTMVV